MQTLEQVYKQVDAAFAAFTQGIGVKRDPNEIDWVIITTGADGVQEATGPLNGFAESGQQPLHAIATFVMEEFVDNESYAVALPLYQFA
jgi:hypothetical protein